MFPREFVEWLIHNTMEATTYSPMLYLKYQSKDDIAEHGGQWFDFTREWHIDDLYKYWRLKIEPKILKEREAALKKLFIRKEDENK